MAEDDSKLNDSVPIPQAETKDAKHKRDDRDNESFAAYQTRLAAKQGMNWMVKNGKVIMFKETDIESKPATITFTDGVTPIISAKFVTTSQGMYAKGKHQHIDPKTGKVTTSEFTPANPPKGCKAVLNIRHRPDYEGDTDDPDPDPTVPIGQGAPGSEGLTAAKKLAAGLIADATGVIQGVDAKLQELV